MDEKENNDYEPMIQKTMEKSKKSKFANYSDMFVGKKGFFAFLKYEILTTWFSNCPGAVGIVLGQYSTNSFLRKSEKGLSLGNLSPLETRIK